MLEGILMVYLFRSIYVVVFVMNYSFSANLQFTKQIDVSKNPDLVDELLCNDVKGNYSEVILASFKKNSLEKINTWIDTIAPSNDVQFLHAQVSVQEESEIGPCDRTRDGFKKAMAHCINGLQLAGIKYGNHTQKVNLANMINLYEQFEIAVQKKLINFIDSLLPNNGLLLNPSLFSCNLIDVKMKVCCKRDSFKDSVVYVLQNA